MAEEIKTKLIIRLLLLAFPLFWVFGGIGQNIIFPDTIRSCSADSILLNAGPGFDVYTWSTGDTTSSAWIYETGPYFVDLNQGDSVFVLEEFYVVLMSVGILNNDTSINCGDTITLRGSDTSFLYSWTPVASAFDSVVVYPRDTSFFYALITDPDSPELYCIDSVKVTIEPVIVVDTTMQISIGCPGEDKAKIQLEVSGGFLPYEYDWPQDAIPLFEDPSYAIGLTDGDKTVVITDSIGCYINHNFYVKAHRLPEMELYSDPEEEVYLQNPYMTFSYENPLYDSLEVDTFYLSWWEWNFGDSIKSTDLSPTHVYQKTGEYPVVLKYKTFYECEGNDTLHIEVKPVQLNIPGIITPNGDDANDTFEIWEGSGGNDGGESYKFDEEEGPIDLSKYYLSNTLVIFNRWGERIYEVDNYENNWDAEGINDGTYFYILKCIGEHQTDVFKGSVMVFTGEATY